MKEPWRGAAAMGSRILGRCKDMFAYCTIHHAWLGVIDDSSKYRADVGQLIRTGKKSPISQTCVLLIVTKVYNFYASVYRFNEKNERIAGLLPTTDRCHGQYRYVCRKGDLSRLPRIISSESVAQ